MADTKPLATATVHGKNMVVNVLTEHLREAGVAYQLRDEIKALIEQHKLTLEPSSSGEWTLPGKWPTREPEVKKLVGILTGLHSRCVTEPLSKESDLAQYGLDNPAVIDLVPPV